MSKTEIRPRFDVGLGARPRAVKPITSGYVHYPLVAFDGVIAMTEEGEVLSLSDYLRNVGTCIVVTNNVEALSEILGREFPYHRRYLSKVASGPYHSRSTLERFHPRASTKRRERMSLVWHPEGMDPTLRKRINRGSTVTDLMRFGLDLRSWLETENLPPRAKLTSIAARLFRDSRFWPDGKGMVPTFINEFARTHLPGGYVRTFVGTGTDHAYPLVACYDQNQGYHVTASNERLPDGTQVFARGHYYDHLSSEVLIPAGPQLERFLQSQSGLLKVKLANGPDGRVRFYPEKLNSAFMPERHPLLQGVTYLWTSELECVFESGAEIEYLIAAWTSPAKDDGYNSYGRYAIEQLRVSDRDRKAWLKPTLHMVHGIGGARSRPRQFGIQPSHPKGIPATYWVGARMVEVKEISVPARTIPTTNTLALGVIQAALLRKTYELANALERFGYRVLHTHTDSVHIAVDREEDAPMAGDEWSREFFRNVVYENQSWFRSDEKVCHPGERFGGSFPESIPAT
jgi:hypothetical protein